MWGFNAMHAVCRRAIVALSHSMAVPYATPYRRLDATSGHRQWRPSLRTHNNIKWCLPSGDGGDLNESSFDRLVPLVRAHNKLILPLQTNPCPARRRGHPTVVSEHVCRYFFAPSGSPKWTGVGRVRASSSYRVYCLSGT
jgi:hypothetical protein